MSKFSEDIMVDGDDNFLSASGKERKAKRTAKKVEKAEKKAVKKAEKAANVKPTGTLDKVKPSDKTVPAPADTKTTTENKESKIDKLKSVATLLGMGLGSAKKASVTEPEPLKKADSSKIVKYVLIGLAATAVVGFLIAPKFSKK